LRFFFIEIKLLRQIDSNLIVLLGMFEEKNRTKENDES